MKKLCFVLLSISLFLLAFLVGPIHAQPPAQPKPGPEQQQLAVWVGQWQYAGDAYETPLSPKGHFVGKTITRLIANGFVLEQRWSEKDGDGLDLFWYDAAAQGYRFQSFEPDGAVSTGSLTVQGKTLTTTGIRIDAKGQRARVRWTSTLSPDGKSTRSKQECSVDDGKTWLVWWELASKKVGK